MRKILVCLIVMGLVLSMTYLSYGDEGDLVDVIITDYDVSVNGQFILNDESQYPVITYKNITYFPMTSDYLNGIGLNLNFSKEEGLKINSNGEVGQFKQSFLGASNVLGSVQQARLAPFSVEVNGKKIDNSQEAFPVLLYNNITYFPLTWRFAVEEFKWDISWTYEDGLTIIAKDNAVADSTRPLIVSSYYLQGDFHEGWSSSAYDIYIRQLVWGFGLMTYNSMGGIVDSPMVEEKWVSDDMLEWTFKIREGIKFHNGEDLSVSDIKFTYDFYLDERALEAQEVYSNLKNYVESVEINEEENTVTFSLKNVDYTIDFNVFCDKWILAEETITKQAAFKGRSVYEQVKKTISSPIGYGPYILDKYAPDEYVKLKVNPLYIGKVPEIKEIIVKVTQSEVALDLLQSGDLDLVSRLSRTEINDAKKDPALKNNIYYRSGGGALFLHADYEAFVLKEVRQAFAYAFNRPKLIKLHLNGFGISTEGPYNKNQWMLYDDNEKELIGTGGMSAFESTLINYDILDKNGDFDEDANITKAHELLDIASKRSDGEYSQLTGNSVDGYKWKGESLNIKIAITEYWENYYNEVWNEDYVSKLGFDVTVENLGWAILFSHFTGNSKDDREFHVFTAAELFDLKFDVEEGYGSKGISAWGESSQNGSRFSGGSSYSSDEWDQLLESIDNTHAVTGDEKYMKLWREFVIAMNEEIPIIPLYNDNYYDVYTSDLENFNTHALWPWTKAILDAKWK